MKKRRATKRSMSLAKRIAKDRTAPAGMFRLLLVDTWNPPGDHVVIGDFGTVGSARGEGLRWVADDPWAEAVVYDDQGRVCAPVVRWVPSAV